MISKNQIKRLVKLDIPVREEELILKLTDLEADLRIAKKDFVVKIAELTICFGGNYKNHFHVDFQLSYPTGKYALL